MAAFAGPCAVVAAAAGEGGTIGVRLVDVPASSADDPRAQLYVVDHGAPGTVIQRTVEVSTTASDARIRLYASAASVTDGAFLGAEGDTPNELSTWTSVRPGEVQLAAGRSGTATATVTIAVRADAAPGERYGVVWAEARSASSSGVTQVNRVGIRLYLSVGPGGAPAADFTINSLAAQRAPDGTPMVVALVENTGGRALDLSGTLDLRSTAGAVHAGPYPADLGVTLGIGESHAVVIPIVDELSAGPWDAVITLHSGLVERSAEAELTFPAVGGSPPVATRPVTPGGLSALLGIFVAGVLVLLVAGLVAVLVRLRRRWASTDLVGADAPGPGE